MPKVGLGKRECKGLVQPRKFQLLLPMEERMGNRKGKPTPVHHTDYPFHASKVITRREQLPYKMRQSRAYKDESRGGHYVEKPGGNGALREASWRS